MNEVTFASLVGKHMFSGVDRDAQPVHQYGTRYEDCTALNFVLDGVTYTAVEDPDDGYRSSMAYFIQSDTTVLNVFHPVEVLARLREDDRYESNDVLELVDTTTGKVVLAVGTGNTNDYYPYFVAEWYPENLAVNAPHGTTQEPRTP